MSEKEIIEQLIDLHATMGIARRKLIECQIAADRAEADFIARGGLDGVTNEITRRARINARRTQAELNLITLKSEFAHLQDEFTMFIAILRREPEAL